MHSSADITLVIVDAHTLFRDGIRVLLGAHTDLRIVGEAADARAGYPQILELRPRVAVIDLSLRTDANLRLVRMVTETVAGTPVLVLTADAHVDRARAAARAGATGFAAKLQPASEILQAMRTVGRGMAYVAPCWTGLLDPSLLGAPGSKDEPLAALSAREREVFGLIVRGMSNQELARTLGIAMKTVETHREHILRKLGLHSAADLVRFAVRNGLPLD